MAMQSANAAGFTLAELSQPPELPASASDDDTEGRELQEEADEPLEELPEAEGASDRGRAPARDASNRGSVLEVSDRSVHDASNRESGREASNRASVREASSKRKNSNVAAAQRARLSLLQSNRKQSRCGSAPPASMDSDAEIAALKHRVWGSRAGAGAYQDFDDADLEAVTNGSFYGALSDRLAKHEARLEESLDRFAKRQESSIHELRLMTENRYPSEGKRFEPLTEEEKASEVHKKGEPRLPDGKRVSAVQANTCDVVSPLPRASTVESIPKLRPSLQPRQSTLDPCDMSALQGRGSAFGLPDSGGRLSMAGVQRPSTLQVGGKRERASQFNRKSVQDDALFQRMRKSGTEDDQSGKRSSILPPYSVVADNTWKKPKKVNLKGFRCWTQDMSTTAEDNMKPRRWMASLVSPYALQQTVVAVSTAGQSSENGCRFQSTFTQAESTTNGAATLMSWLQVLKILVNGIIFDTLCGLVIIANTAVIGAETEYGVYNAERSSGYFTVQIVFNIWYCLELMLRIWAADFKVFATSDWKWSVFDFMLVSLSVVELCLEFLDSSGWVVIGRLIRSIRILRVVRTLRIVRVLRYVREFRKMIFSIAASMQTLLWSLVLMSVIMYIFAVGFTQGVTEFFRENEDKRDVYWEVAENFGSLSKSTYSLYVAISGGQNWSLVAEPLIAVNPVLFGFMLFYVSVAIFGVLNVVTAVFVESAMQSSTHYRDLLIQEKMHDKEMYVKHIREVFKQIDRDGADAISIQDVEFFLHDESLRMYLEALEINLVETHSLFRLLDKDGSGLIDINEFCEGCLRLKGDAKSFDIHCLLYENQRMLTKWTDFMEFVEREFHALQGYTTRNRESMAAGRHSTSNSMRNSMASEAPDVVLSGNHRKSSEYCQSEIGTRLSTVVGDSQTCESLFGESPATSYSNCVINVCKTKSNGADLIAQIEARAAAQAQGRDSIHEHADIHNPPQLLS